MIHTCPKRRWYVDEYLVPSLLQLTIPQKHILIYEDTNSEGALESCVKSFGNVPYDDDGIWHLQDDILVCHDFKQRTEQLDDGIVCGIATEYDRERKNHLGTVLLYQMWYSFPCIRIPNKIAKDFATWYNRYMRDNPVYKHLTKTGKHDDMMFRMFLEETDKYCNIKVMNAHPNLVEHVDWLLGGSTINYHRPEPIKALYFSDTYLTKELEEKLNGRG